ncbi:hypothetical protein I5R10_00465 [Pseudomonas aeruginosa]|nr:hypothetical protein [Pseudomonas aeruginosa]
MNKANECTCPSGDGSLRWPCPKHPAVEQAGANVGHGHVFPRADGVKMRCGGPALCSECAADAYRARAALAQPSPAIATAPTYQFHSREIGESDWAPCDFSRYLYCSTSPEMDTRVVEVTAQPSPAQAEAELPEVVAYADPVAFARFKERGHEGGVAGREWMWAEPTPGLVAMSRTDECERIVGALREEVASLKHSRQVLVDSRNAHRNERDAALARVAELEKELAMARDAASKGDAARHAACGMEMEIEELRAELAELRARVVVVPVRDTGGSYYEEGWNACLDELARLNGLTVSEGLLRTACFGSEQESAKAMNVLRALLSEQEGGKP